MSDAKKLVFLRAGGLPEDKSFSGLDAFATDIPDKGDIKKLTFRGPYPIYARRNLDRPIAKTPGPAIYHPGADEIVWACNGGPTHLFNKKLNVNLWRIGPHFQLVAVENTPLQAMNRDANPSVAIDSTKVSVVALHKTSNDTDDSDDHGSFFFARRSRARESQSNQKIDPYSIRHEEHMFETVKMKDAQIDEGGRYYDQNAKIAQPPTDPWIDFPLNAGNTRDTTRALLYRKVVDEVKYIFFFRQRIENNDKTLWIDTMRAAKYAEMDHYSANQWQSFIIDMPFNVPDSTIAPIILADRQLKKFRLYIFALDSQNQGIQYTYIPLRKDGSIDSYENRFKVTDVQKISVATLKPSSSALQVHEVHQTSENHNKLILTWSESDSQKSVHAYVAALDATTGYVPNGAAWSNVELEFSATIPRASNANAPVYYVSCLVPNEFE